ncbi:MAG: YebC/PmpR family DNA-binding transcriptional regulator, partial [Myxococcales bacterium]|nr:YebC/PmpR family DNA-binding transcriptional regulator [Myxococcales bacterium]
MAGHSKWANIKRRKGAQDAKRGKVFTKIIKEISVAAKMGGGDADANPRLRAAVLAAKAENMPKDNIERAIKKATGADAADYIEQTFEGYGPGGVAVFVEVATDNHNRTVSSVRSYFNKSGGSLGKDGCLQFIFEQKGVFSFPKGDLDEEELMLELIDAGAEDIETEDGTVNVTCEVADFGNLQKKLYEMGIEPESASLERLPLTMQKVDDLAILKPLMKLVDQLEEDDD